MFRAIDLDEFAAAGAAGAWRIAAAGPLRAGHPEAGGNHPAPERLDRQREVVRLGELLEREGGTKIGVRSRMSDSARSRVAAGSRRLLGRPRRRDAKPAAPARLNAR